MAAPVVPGSQPPQGQPGPTPDTVGSWTAPKSWPLVAVHASMLSNGKVALWDGFGAAMGSERIWDPATESFQATPSGLNLFCSGHVLLPDGRLFVTGGHVLPYAGIRDTTLLNPLTGSWAAGPQMARGRWYPTATTLPDGRVLIVSGDGIPTTPGPYNAFYFPSDTVPEVYNPATNTLNQMPSAARRMPLYPLMFVAPDGRVVDAGPDTTTRLLDVQTGQWSTLASQSPIDGHSAVMYRPGKILKSGTWGDPDFPSSVPITNRAAELDLNQTVPAWREVAPMKSAAHVPHAHRPAGRRRDGDGRHTVRARERRDDLGSARAGDLASGDRHLDSDGAERAAARLPQRRPCCSPTGASCSRAAAGSTAR